MSEVEMSDFANANAILADRVARNEELINKITNVIANISMLTSRGESSEAPTKSIPGHLNDLAGISCKLGDNNETLAYILENLTRMVN